MNKSIKIMLVLTAVVLIALSSVVFVLELTGEKKERVTDPAIAHLPVRAHLHFSGFPTGPALNETVSFVYVLVPSVDLKIDVSEGIVLPEGIVFVEDNLSTGQITLSKGEKYRYDGKLKIVTTGNWTIYASSGMYANVNVSSGGEESTAWLQGVFDATTSITKYRIREKVSEERQCILMNIAKNWLREHGVHECENEEFNCSIISRPLSRHISMPASRICDINVKCYGCEMKCYSNSVLCDKYYFIIDEDLHTNETRVRNVYRWVYWTPKGYQQKPVCEEITMKGGENDE